MSASQNHGEQEMTEAAAQQALGLFLNAIQNKDSQAIGELYEEDGIYYLSNGEAIRGKEEIIKFFEAGFRTRQPESAELSLKPVQTVVTEDFVIMAQEFRAATCNDGQDQTISGHQVIVFKLSDEGAKILIDIDTGTKLLSANPSGSGNL